MLFLGASLYMKTVITRHNVRRSVAQYDRTVTVIQKTRLHLLSKIVGDRGIRCSRKVHHVLLRQVPVWYIDWPVLQNYAFRAYSCAVLRIIYKISIAHVKYGDLHRLGIQF